MTQSTKGRLSVLLAAILWSLSGIIIISVQTSPPWIIFIRCLSAGLCTLPFLMHKKVEPKIEVFKTAILYVIFITSFTVTTLLGGAAMAVAMQYAAPLYVMMYFMLKSKKIDKDKIRTFFALLIGIIFCLIDSIKSSNIFAIIVGILVGLTFVMYTRGLQKITEGSHLGIVSAINLIGAFSFMFVLPFNMSSKPKSINHVLILIAAGVFISALSYSLYSLGLKKISLEQAMIIALAEPILNPIWVYLVIKNIPPYTTIVGLVFILIGVFLEINSNNNKKT